MRLSKVVCAALLVLVPLVLLSAGGRAQESGMSPELRALVEAERAFSRMSREKGMKEAFIFNAADDGLLFRRTPVNAKELWRQRNPAPTALLTWAPDYADISRAGDVGFTAGPWELRPNPTDEKPAAHGHFITVWRKQTDGSWKFALDIGISHPAPTSPDSTVRYAVAREKKGKPTDANVEAERKALADAERELAQTAARRGLGAALVSHAAADLRLYREGKFPFVGKQAASAALAGETAANILTLTRADVSRSGDLGYAYGAYELKPPAADAKPPERGHYMRLWKKHGDKWRVVLDVTNAIPPAQ